MASLVTDVAISNVLFLFSNAANDATMLGDVKSESDSIHLHPVEFCWSSLLAKTRCS